MMVFTIGVVAALLSIAAAHSTSTVTSIFQPFSNTHPLVASLIAQVSYRWLLYSFDSLIPLV